DYLLGTVPHAGGLTVGNTYPGTLTAEIPGLAPGDYHVIVQSDRRSQVSQADRSNDVLASTATINLDVPFLPLDTPTSDAFQGVGDRHYYQILPPVGQSLMISLDSLAAAGATAIYVSRNALPTPGVFDFRGGSFQPDATVVVPTTAANSVYYVL